MSNSEMWMLVEQDKVVQWSVFKDDEGNNIIWTGKSFQAYDEIENKYVGMCLGDTWEFVGVDNSIE